MLHYETIPVTAFEQNCSLLWCDETHEAAVIDPGGDLEIILERVSELNVKLKQIWVTHAHIDHAGSVDELSTRLSLPVIGPHPEDQFWIDQLSTQGARTASVELALSRPPSGCMTWTLCTWEVMNSWFAIAQVTHPVTWSFTPKSSTAPLSVMCSLRGALAGPISRVDTTRL